MGIAIIKSYSSGERNETPTVFKDLMIDMSGYNITLEDLNEVTNIPDHAFEGCYFLTSIDIPEGINRIPYYSLSDCYKLTDIVIPTSVIELGRYALYNCQSLESISYNGTVAEWNSINKGENWDLNTGNYTVYCTDGEISKQ